MELDGLLLTDWQPHEKKVVMKLTLVRHGETVANRDRIVQGQTPGELTDFGREQAKRLGKRLAGQHWDALYCSDLVRTQQTAQELLCGAGADISAVMEGADADIMTDASCHRGGKASESFGETRKGAFPKMISMTILRERSAGELEGGPSGCVEAASKAAGAEWRSFRPPKGESWEDVQARADRFLRWLVEFHLSHSAQRPAATLESIPASIASTKGARNGQRFGRSALGPLFTADFREEGLHTATKPHLWEASLPRRIPQSSSFQVMAPDAHQPESSLRRRVLRSGSFSGEPRAAGRVLGLPRSNSSNEIGFRVSGVKRAGSFHAAAPKMMKRVDSLGLSKMFLEGGQDEGKEKGEGSAEPSAEVRRRGENGNEDVSGGASDMDEDLREQRTAGGSDIRTGAANGRGEDHDEEMLVYEFDLGAESSRGDEKETAAATQAALGSGKEGQRTEEAQAQASQVLPTEDTRAHSHLQQSANERKDEESVRQEERTSKGEGRAKRKGGRPRVVRVLAVTHGGFIKEFVNAAMAYAEGPNLSRTRLQTRQSLSWQKRSKPAQGLEFRGRALNGPLGPMQGLGLRGDGMIRAPIQIQRTLGHNDFVSIRAVHENGNSEVLTPRNFDFDAFVPPTRLRFDRDKAPLLPEEQQVEAPRCQLELRSVRRADGSDFDGIGETHVQAKQGPVVYPGRPKNASVYEFEIKRLEGRDGMPQFTVKLIRENDIWHLNGLVPSRPFRGPQANHQAAQKVLCQAPTAKLLN